VSDSEKPTLLVIDGHSLAFRAFYALPLESFQTSGGQYTNAIHGFLSMFLTILQAEKPTHVAVAFDISRYSFRTAEYPEYKGTRGETPPEFIGQVPLLQEALHAMRIPTMQMENYEADDILATLATKGEAAGMRVLVVSGDRDTFQLVTDEVTVLYPSARGVSELKRYTPDAVEERYGIRPHQYPDIAALVGETSDNLPGVDKVGEKTAVKWIQQYGSLDEVIAHRDEIVGVVGNNLREQLANVERNARLNKLVRTLDLPIDIADLVCVPIEPNEVVEVFDRLQFRTLKQRVLQFGGSGIDAGNSSAIAEHSAARVPVREQISSPTPIHLGDEELAKWLSDHSDSRVAVVIEQGDDGLVIGLATADACVRSIRASDSLDHVAFDTWLASSAPKLVHDGKLLGHLLSDNGLSLAGIARDTRVAAWLNDSASKSLALVDIARSLTGLDVPVADPNELVPSVDPASVAITAWILTQLDAELEILLDEGQQSIERDIEIPLIPILMDMERVGIAMDVTILDDIYRRVTETADSTAQKLFSMIGREINLSSPKQLQEVLFDQLDMPKTRATKTGFSTDAASLADLQASTPHPFLDGLLEHREQTKLAQIVEGLRKSVQPDGRIHTTYDQTGTTTGRLSSSEPNLQNIPIRSETGAEIRAAFVADRHHDGLLTADYSQIEMRIMAHLSGDESLVAAFQSGEDLHRFVGAKVFGVEPGDVTPAMRTKVKAMSYGLAYGLSAFGLAKQLRIDNKEAKSLMSDYFSRFGGVRDYLRSVVEQARKDLFTRTVFGRKRQFRDLASSNRLVRDNAERAALNAPIQGTSADIMKIAMIRAAEGVRNASLSSRLLLQVHDELIFEIAPGETEKLHSIVEEAMEHAVKLSVPLDVQVGIGSSWKAAGH
jgi:DNA polymerase-1